MDSLAILLGEPVKQLLEACRGVEEDFIIELAAVIDETRVELQFGDVKAKSGFSHGGELMWNQMQRFVKIADASSASVEAASVTVRPCCAARVGTGS